jgi:DNA-binding transcriptional ArsR family regulator
MTTQAQRQQAAANRIKALSHPVRAAALRYLNTNGTGSPGEIADALDEDITNVSYHIRRLAKLDCVELVSTEPVRGTVRHVYRPVREHLVERDEWADLPEDAKKTNLIQSGEPAFQDFRIALDSGTLGQDEHFSVIRLPLAGMDRKGLEEVTEICERAFREAQAVPERCLERRNVSDEEPIKVSFSLLAFEVPDFAEPAS